MPSKAVHEQKATENEALSNRLDLSMPSAANWAIIMTFYSALHYVEAYFKTQSQGYRFHPDRDNAIFNDGRIGGVWRPYERLKDASENARYEDVFFTPNQFQLMRVNLNAIKAVITPLL